MKYKKYSYILVLILMLIVGINGVHAKNTKTCYYISSDNDFQAKLNISWGYEPGFLGMDFRTLDDYVKVTVDKNKIALKPNNEMIVNWWDSGVNNWYSQCTKGNAVCFKPYYNTEKDANNDSNPNCPKYMVFQHCTFYYIWATESKIEAEKAVQDAVNNGCTGYYASYQTADGDTITAEDYYGGFTDSGMIDFDNTTLDCDDMVSIFGDKTDAGNEAIGDPPSIAYVLDVTLQYVRIIVPILIIVLGTIDLAKAVLAGKEDVMRKAQTDFIKRLVIGVAVFFVPVLVDIVMELANIVWYGTDYVSCKL